MSRHDEVGVVPTTEEDSEPSGRADLSVLNLVTTAEARFFKQQVSVLEDLGVSSTTVAVPDERVTREGALAGRSAVDYFRFLPRAIRESFGEYDLVHANYGLTAPAAVLQPNLPVVISLWGSDLYGRFGPLSKLCARLADATIVMSDGMATELGGTPYVIPHGIDLDRFQPADQQAAQEDLGWDPGRKHVLFPYAKGKSVKNAPLAERVVAAARERVGEPIELQFVTGVPHERMSVYMNAADALLLTSDREGSPNSVKEAMACNLPVIATDVGDVRQRLRGVQHSFVAHDDADLVDCLVSVLDADTDSNGRAVIAELRIEQMGERLLSVYREVLDG
ncbi:glycosyltransferase [Natranaeroarchaeum aerophilus]|uniref:Glycosyltransferase n=1 Tax=Natranaeroarchaeum aerophilus TaxID=2917711 RepID=A0AAE3FRK4_9EURY|nr:glycosyltransferase [Natranaeroarchaeum aerophilus]MCL9814028.1 glycosyltransferase [Natranaeroarchaeum aerophilus]